MEIDSKWIDEDGNLAPDSKGQGSENPTLFNVMLYLMLDLDQNGLTQEQKETIEQLVRNKWETNNGKYMTNDNDTEDSFSLDESQAVAAAHTRFNQPENIDKLIILTKQTWFRFYDVIPYLLLAKYPNLKYLGILQLMTYFFSGISCLAKPEVTSGKQLAFLKCIGRNNMFVFKIYTMLLKIRGQKWVNVFQAYYPEHYHPINILVRNNKMLN